MPANLILKNAANVDVTMTPMDVNVGAKVTWADASQDVLAKRATAEIEKKTIKAGNVVTGKVYLPVFNATTGLLDYYLPATLTVVRPKMATGADCDGILNRVAALASSAAFKSAVKDNVLS